MPSDPSRFTAICRSHASERGPRRAFLFSDGDEENDELSFHDLDVAARAIGAALQDRHLVGERVLLLLDAASDFIRSFFGCLYGGVIAVPVNLPTRKQRLEKVQSILKDSGAKVALTTAAMAADLRASGISLECLDVEALLSPANQGLADAWRDPNLAPDAPAFLQYTSGSTGAPKGVVVSHGNLLANEEMIKRSFGHDEETVFAGWLPLYHDMGLVGNVLQPMFLGIPCVLMPPVKFVQQPSRWLRLISQYRATTSGAPNFAYELCVKRIPDDELANIDLRSWKVAFNGAEPIRADTLARFCRKFEPYGFRRQAFYPCYGMAEATLFISGGFAWQAPTIHSVRADALEIGQVAVAVGDSPDPVRVRALVGCGRPWMGEAIAIVDPNSLERCASGVVGEIWVAGSNVAGGYWQNPQASDATFRAITAAGEGPFLRTGDLGFLHDEELFITGRIKDVIVVAGKNHYPQDLEQTAAQSHPAFDGRPGAAISLEVEGREDVAVVQEVGKSFLSAPLASDATLGDELRAQIRDAIVREHGIAARTVVLIPPGALPMTTSGKVQRSRCRTMLLEKSFAEVFAPPSRKIEGGFAAAPRSESPPQ